MRKIKSILKKYGISISRYNKRADTEYLYSQLLKSIKVTTILDVGAHYGEYAVGVLQQNDEVNIISYEAASTAYKKLCEKSHGVERWKIAERCAVSNFDGEAEFNLSLNEVSSSLKRVNKTHVENESRSFISAIEKVKVINAKKLIEGIPVADTLLKLDVQGAEYEIVKCLFDNDIKFKAIQIEVSLVSLYEGSVEYMEIINLMIDSGYKLLFVDRAFSSAESGATLQLDLMFGID